MKLTAIQPGYYAGDAPDESIAELLLSHIKAPEPGSLTLLPEYSNAGGLSDPERILAAVGRAESMKFAASASARASYAYIALNVLERRDGRLYNSTYLYDRSGEVAFVYDKIHLPPSEVALGITPGSGACVCELDGIRVAFMTCYDVYFSEQTEHIALAKPDLILVPGYQRGERTDIIRAQAILTAFRCNAYLLRSSYSMGTTERGGCTMLVSPDGRILADIASGVGSIAHEVDIGWKFTRPAGFGAGLVPNDEFISSGRRPDIFAK